MSMPSDDAMSNSGTAPFRRIEVFTEAGGRRRRWSAERKAAIVAESYAGVGSVCDVARRHGLTPTQLFTWRRTARRGEAAQGEMADALFVPALVEASIDKGAREPTGRRASADGGNPLIGVEIGGASVWICRGADVGTVTAIVKALKGGE
jgi:transposase